ncbi:MAG: restriction endonuclease subunit S [Magnetococcales bacterium]|nr:restriction endonuclease subunit S [Magnetococcales bacterium]MBF0165694.1 restriction endonuclease subunit S [Magnetococcales bacterium]
MSEPPLIDIRPDHWEIVRAILNKHLPDREVWAFGSRAKWTAKQYSDLDLAILGDEPLDLGVLAGLEEDFSESDLPFKVDVVDWATTAEGFRKIIERDRVVVQLAKGTSCEWGAQSLESCMEAIIDYRGKTPQKTLYGIPLITAKIVKGGRIETPDEFIAVEDYEQWMTRGIPKAGDVVVTTEAPLGQVAQLGNERVALAQRLIALRGKSRVLDNGFLKFLMQSENVQDQLHARASGTTVLGIKQSELRNVLLTLPPYSEQRAIAQVLGALDDKIELNRRMNADLEAMARALFKDWFVDFGPVRAKAEGRPAYLAQEIWDLFPDAMDDEDKPVGWRLDCLGAFTDLQNGYAFKSADWRDEGVPVVKIGSVKPSVVDLNEVSYISPSLAKERSAFRLNIGDTLVGLTGYVGETGRVPPTINPPMLNQRVARFSSSGKFSPFVYACVRDPAFKIYAENKAHGSAQANVSTKDLLTYPVINPNIRIVSSFEGLVAPLFDKSLANLGEMGKLATTRDLLLPKLITGEIRVKDAERWVGDVVG